jgi:hypothetical protein
MKIPGWIVAVFKIVILYMAIENNKCNLIKYLLCKIVILILIFVVSNMHPLAFL